MKVVGPEKARVLDSSQWVGLRLRNLINEVSWGLEVVNIALGCLEKKVYGSQEDCIMLVCDAKREQFACRFVQQVVLRRLMDEGDDAIL